MSEHENASSSTAEADQEHWPVQKSWSPAEMDCSCGWVSPGGNTSVIDHLLYKGTISRNDLDGLFSEGGDWSEPTVMKAVPGLLEQTMLATHHVLRMNGSAPSPAGPENSAVQAAEYLMTCALLLQRHYGGERSTWVPVAKALVMTQAAMVAPALQKSRTA